MITLQHTGPEIVFSMTMAVPVMLTLLLGRLIYRDRLTAKGWIGCVLGVAGIVASSEAGNAKSRPSAARSETRRSRVLDAVQHKWDGIWAAEEFGLGGEGVGLGLVDVTAEDTVRLGAGDIGVAVLLITDATPVIVAGLQAAPAGR